LALGVLNASTLREFAFFLRIIKYHLAPVLARFALGRATALRATYKAGRRGGDSIARGRHFYLIILAPERAVVAF